MLIRNAELREHAALDLRIRAGRIEQIAARLDAAPGESVLDARGGALLPGLHDHHLHLLALAAARTSLCCGPPQVSSQAALEEVLRTAPGSGWLRGIRYHDSVAGALDRDALDRLLPMRPVRIQHRSGAMWMLNSKGVDALRLDAGEHASGVERDASGRATGRLWRLDAWLRERLDPSAAPSLREVSSRLASFGVCGVTDATPSNSNAEMRLFEDAARSGALRQRLLVMGGADLPASRVAQVESGARKFLLHEDALPDFDTFCAEVGRAHAASRPVAVHCVTRTELVYALEMFEAVGRGPGGDRIEHAAIAPPELTTRLFELGLCVVTQPNFVRERGDAYLAEVDARDQPWLYRCGELIAAGVATGGGTDAPFGDPDPWLAMQAAVDRKSCAGRTLGASDAVSPERALALFTSPADAPGSEARRIEVGAAADLCLLDGPWKTVRNTLSSESVAATIRAGELIHRKS